MHGDRYAWHTDGEAASTLVPVDLADADAGRTAVACGSRAAGGQLAGPDGLTAARLLRNRRIMRARAMQSRSWTVNHNRR
ncbi:hypothetical protein BRAS3809_4470003 [Bradyrhizobium sp. STM 3809]|nr:hypothetical protein BRAS3809_4470003 [Bradyrhizobium sp. STM 3809]